MSPAILGSLIALSLALAGALVQVGVLLQRVKTLEDAKHSPDTAVATLQTEMKGCHARLKDLESDRKAHGESLSELRGEMRGLKESIDRLQETMHFLADLITKAG